MGRPLGDLHTDYASAYVPDPRPEQHCPDCHARISRYNADYGMRGARCAVCEGKAAEALAADRAAKGQLMLADASDPEEERDRDDFVWSERGQRWYRKRTRRCADCGNWRKIAAKDMCHTCYSRQLEWSKGRRPQKPSVRECVECERVLFIQGHGLCRGCYSRRRKALAKSTGCVESASSSEATVAA